ncbi:MAG: hypothetical protein JW699_06005 [Chitinispirillaceae bacterium]|nr:hypothetical protein [Chitinispirillaceae bacterium]
MMQNKILATCALAVSLAFGEPPWRQSDFIIGTCEDPCLSDNIDLDPSDSTHRAQYDSDRYNYQHCKNAYFNFTTGHNHLRDGRPCDVPVLRGQDKTDYALHIAAEAGLKSLVLHEPWASCNCRATFLGFMRTENTSPYKTFNSYAEYLLDHYRSLGAPRYAALHGFHIAAEPGPRQSDVTCGSDGFTHGIDTLKMWVRSFKIHCPEKQSHVFILPTGAIGGAFRDSTSYKAHIDTVFNDEDTLRQPQVVCNNSYPLWDPGLRPIENNFFWGLNTCRDRAGNRPFWNHAHCIFTYRDGDERRDPRFHTYIPPDEAVLRWNAMVNVAHGVRGILWFAYRGFNGNAGIWGNFGEGVVDCDNRSPLIKGSVPQRTEYDAVREINRYLACIAGPAVMTSDFVNVYHKKQSGPAADKSFTVFPGQSGVPAGQILGAGADSPVLFDIGNKKVMAGVFRDRVDTAVYYVLAVNKEWKLGAGPISRCAIAFKGDLRGKVSIAPRAYGYDGATAFAPLFAVFRPGRDLTTVTLPDPLLSGESRLIKVTAAGAPFPRRPGFRPHGTMAAARNNIDKRIICFARGTDGRIYARIQDTANVDFWGQEWRLVSDTPTAGDIACANFGRHYPITIASTTIDGKLQYTFQSRPFDRKNPLLFEKWRTCAMKQKINGPIICSFFGSSEEHLAFFFRFGDSLHYALLGRAGDCRGPYPVTQVDPRGSHVFGVGRNSKGAARGTIDIFVARPTGRIFRARMTASGLLERRPPEFADFGCSASGDLHVATDPDGALEIFFTREGGGLSHTRQRSPGSAEWEHIDEQVKAYGGIASGIDRDGNLVLFARDSSGYLCSITRHSAGSRLDAPIRLGPGPVTVGPLPASVAKNGDGRLTVFALGDGGANVFYTSQGKKGCGVEWQNCLPFTNLSDRDR